MYPKKVISFGVAPAIEVDNNIHVALQTITGKIDYIILSADGMFSAIRQA